MADTHTEKESSEFHVGNVELWEAFVMQGYLPRERVARQVFRRLPKSPRCRLCYAPFSGVGASVVRVVFNRKRSNFNPQICNACELYAEKYPGGVESDMTFLFADVRGSTALSEKMGTAAFSRLIDRFFRTATEVLADSGAFIEKMVGDEVTGLFFPGLAGQEYSCRAVEAARNLLVATGHTDPSGPWAPVGIGIHAGRAFFGSVGSQTGVHNITVLGEAANIGARLSSRAAAGEVLISGPAVISARLEVDGLERRSLDLKGVSEPVDAWVVRVSPS